MNRTQNRSVRPASSVGRLPGTGGFGSFLRAFGGKALGAAILAVIFACLQSCFFTRFDTFPFFGATPDLLLVLTVGFSYFAGGLFSGSESGAGSAGAVMGLFCGILSNAFCTGGSFPLAIPAFCLTGYLAGFLNAALPLRSFRAYWICQVFALPVRVILTLVSTMEFCGGIFSPMLIFTSFLPEAAATGLFAVLLFPLFRRMMRPSGSGG